MMPDEPCHIVGKFGEADSRHHARNQVRPDLGMAEGADSPVDQTGRGSFPDIVEKHPPENPWVRLRGNSFNRSEGVDVGVSFLMILLWLCNAFQGCYFGEKPVERAILAPLPILFKQIG